MQIKSLSLLGIFFFSPVVLSGTMANIEQSSTSLLLEGGASYTHFFYKNNVYSAEADLRFNPADYFANNFWGGYIGASIYRNDTWLMNLRYDMFALKGKVYSVANTYSHTAPEKLTLSLDKTWNTSTPLTVGFGGGVVVTTYNEGQFFYYGKLYGVEHGKSYHGRVRMFPLVEGLVMYPITENIKIKLNVGYQIPVTDIYDNGMINTNLGINYSFPL